jgi:hypothetical protein
MWAKPQLASGVQVAMARVAVGKVAPSPMPSASRAANRLAKPPVAAVATTTMMPEIPSVARAPNLSPSQPPTSCKNVKG